MGLGILSHFQHGILLSIVRSLVFGLDRNHDRFEKRAERSRQSYQKPWKKAVIHIAAAWGALILVERYK